MKSDIEALNNQNYGRKRLGTKNFFLEKKDVFAWIANIYIGVGEQTEVPVILDTATDLVAIYGDECSSCEGPKFNN